MPRCGSSSPGSVLDKKFEIVVLRYELDVLRRRALRPAFTTPDRTFLAAASRMKHLQEHCAGMRALDISSNRIRAYHVHHRHEGASPATVNRETSHLVRTFRIAVKSGLLSLVPPFPDRLEERAPRQGMA